MEIPEENLVLHFQGFILQTAVERAVFRSGSSLSAVLSSFCYSLETRPSAQTLKAA